ncbi:MAG: endopeptidase La [Deinococcales bacterium]
MPRAKKIAPPKTVSPQLIRVPVCPVRGSVIYPGIVQSVDAGRIISVAAIQAAADGDKNLFIVSQRNKDLDDPKSEDLFDVGTLTTILRLRRNPDGTVGTMIQASHRARVHQYYLGANYIEADIELLEDVNGDATATLAMKRELAGRFLEIARNKNLQQDTIQFIQTIENPSQLADHIAFNLDFKLEDRQALLEQLDVVERMKRILVLLVSELELSQAQDRIRAQVKEEIDRNQREYFLREQMKAIQKELRGEEEGDDEVEAFRAKIEKLGLNPDTKKEVERELNRLARMHADSAEASVTRTYLTWITELPWNTRSEDRLDLREAEKILGEDHYGLEKVKDRVLEFLAVRALRKTRADKGELEPNEVNKGPILVFVGPPGVGKTSIAKSIAKALGRKYVRIALGGARDEADIRGHRRTYIGSLPGRIIQGLKTAGTKNPVFLLDEIDKQGSSYQGDPSSALLEVLDPAQNAHFTDHYLGVPFDLSEVMFIATANYVEQIPAPLLDRMEFIEFSSYIEAEKLEIAKRYIVPRQILENGLKDNQIVITDAALLKLIQHYTREAGVRTLEREVGALLRKAARKLTSSDIKRVRIGENDLEKYLGPQRHQVERENSENIVGVATGMFYTPVGGDILFVETNVMPGKGLILTGQLGDVMKESARAALSYAKRNAERFHIPLERLDEREIHIHVPAGGIPKEGPSAGVTMTTSLISALTGIPARHDVSMTGEITLTGRVLPIGGLKEKVLGARRAGIKHIVMPKANIPDLEDIPTHLRRSITFHPCESLDQVLEVALEGGLKALETQQLQSAKAVRKARRLEPRARA